MDGNYHKGKYFSNRSGLNAYCWFESGFALLKRSLRWCKEWILVPYSITRRCGVKKSEQWITFAPLALRAAERVLSAYAYKFSPQRYTLPQLAACVLLKEYGRLDWRGIQAWLKLSPPLASVWDCMWCRITRRCGIWPSGGWMRRI